MSEQTDELSFERADYTFNDGGAPCSDCQQRVVGEYWSWQGRVLCASCRAQLERTFGNAQSAGSLAKAALWGGLTALGCGIAYGAFVAVSQMQLALVTIGIGILIAKVVRKASHGIGGRRYQLLAVALTYFASAMGYGPGVWEGITAPATYEVTGAYEESRAASESAAEAVDASGPPEGTGELFGAVLLLVVISMAAPFLAIADAPIGFAIVLFGLWEAWKLSAAIPTEISGPFRVSNESAEAKSARPVAAEPVAT